MEKVPDGLTINRLHKGKVIAELEKLGFSVPPAVSHLTKRKFNQWAATNLDTIRTRLPDMWKDAEESAAKSWTHLAEHRIRKEEKPSKSNPSPPAIRKKGRRREDRLQDALKTSKMNQKQVCHQRLTESNSVPSEFRL